MIFTETILPKGSKVYKGLPRGIRVIRRTRNFFVAQSPRVARGYGPVVAGYETTKPLRLFVLNHANIKALLSKKTLSPSTKIMLRFALGTNTTRAAQHMAYRQVLVGRDPLPGAKNTRPGQRLSILKLDTQVFEKFAREFLVPQKYDGFYSPSKRSIFHGGGFHSEIMVCDAVKSLARVQSTKLGVPVRAAVSHADVIKNLSALFVEYSRTQNRLVRPYGGFVIYLGGGMAVKLYLEARAFKAPAKVLNTTDFDFTFAVPRRLTTKSGVTARIYAMRKIMSTHLSGFTAWLGRKYGVRPTIVVKDFVPPVRLLPSTGKRIYQVISYGLKFPGVAKPVDFVDTTLAQVPRIDRDHIHHVYTRHFGMPIERLKHLSKSVLAVLAGSFATKDPALKSRNPLTGNRAEKGIKNTARLASLIKLKGSHPSTVIRKFVTSIQSGNVRSASRHARRVIKNINKY